QAEDGIRDLYVTGVQTCALPISDRARLLRAPRADDGAAPPPALSGRPHRARAAARTPRATRPRQLPATTAAARGLKPQPLGARRSEERRVGKECRARWARNHEKK